MSLGVMRELVFEVGFDVGFCLRFRIVNMIFLGTIRTETDKSVRDSSEKPGLKGGLGADSPTRSLAGGEAEGHALLIFNANPGKGLLFF